MRKRIAFIANYPRLGRLKENIDNTASKVSDVLSDEIDVIFFPEQSLTGYLLENLSADVALAPGSELLKPIADLSHRTEILVGAITVENRRFYNSMLVFKNGRLVHNHRKIYLPTYGMFDESRYLTPGNNLAVYDGALGRTGILLCEDAWHPAVAYALYARGAEHVFVASSSPVRGFQGGENPLLASQQMWQKRLEIYSESFGQFIYYVNRGGVEDGVYFDAMSFHVSPLSGLENHSTATETRLVQINTEDLLSAAAAGGPFIEENHSLNLELIQSAHETALKRQPQEGGGS